jgi:hypothetical protein
MKPRLLVFLGLCSFALAPAVARADDPPPLPPSSPAPGTGSKLTNEVPVEVGAPTPRSPAPPAPTATAPLAELPAPPSPVPPPVAAPASAPPFPLVIVSAPAHATSHVEGHVEGVDELPTEGSTVDHRESMWRVEIGYRGSYVTDAAYDPFSTNNALPQFSLLASRTLVAGHHLSFAAGLGWDVGGSSAPARGDQASLGIQHLSVPLEGRVHLGRMGYLFVRDGLGAVSAHTQIEDASAAAALSKTQWLFANDVSAGYALLVAPGFASSSPARFWLQADGGYGWVASDRLDLGPRLASSDTRIIGGVDLGTLDLSGAFFRIAAAASF